MIIVHVSQYPVDLLQDLRITGNTRLLVEKQTQDLPSVKVVVQTGYFLESFSGYSLTASVAGVAKEMYSFFNLDIRLGGWSSRPRSIYPRERPGTHCIGGWVGPWAGLDGCGKSEKLTGLQLVKKFPAFHGTRRYVTALTSVRHLSLSWASPIQSHPTSWRTILILSAHLCLYTYI